MVDFLTGSSWQVSQQRLVTASMCEAITGVVHCHVIYCRSQPFLCTVLACMLSPGSGSTECQRKVQLHLSTSLVQISHGCITRYKLRRSMVGCDPVLQGHAVPYSDKQWCTPILPSLVSEMAVLYKQQQQPYSRTESAV